MGETGKRQKDFLSSLLIFARLCSSLPPERRAFFASCRTDAIFFFIIAPQLALKLDSVCIAS